MANGIITSAAKIWSHLEDVPVIGKGLRQLRYPIKQAIFSLQGSSKTAWEDRIAMVLQCPDNALIPRVPDAGLARGGTITMHNGVKILAGSYYGAPIVRLLKESRGVHEPQEERVFEAVIKNISPGGRMIELGAYWAFYSLSFARAIEGAKCIMIEPSKSNLQYGRENFALNNFRGEFVHAFIGSDSAALHDGVPEVTVDQLCMERGITHLQVLHSDIQGAEVQMLDGAKNMLSGHKVDYVFVSTHYSPNGDDLHGIVRDRLKAWNYRIIADVPLAESFSIDGIIVAVSPSIDFNLSFEVSRRLTGSPAETHDAVQ